MLDAGAQMLMLNHVFDHMEHVEALAEEVVPHLEPPGRLGVGVGPRRWRRGPCVLPAVLALDGLDYGGRVHRKVVHPHADCVS